MKIFSQLLLTGAITALGCASCSKAPGELSDPLAGPPGQAENSAAQLQAENGEGPPGSQTETIHNGINANRLRLPDMEKLPSDRELAAKEDPDDNGGSVIARPPSE
ncbi:MAG: hypothetical protein ACO3SO_10085 [Luteolibacter sp.]